MDQEEIVLVELTEEQRAAALKTVCRYAIDKDDALELVHMLALTPAPRSFAHCAECGHAMARYAEPGVRSMASSGLCAPCYRATRTQGGE
jgi:hypothetical protein